MFASCQLTGVNIAFPDICLTPPLPPTGLPVPYLNVSLQNLATGFAPTVLWMGAPAHRILATTIPASLGDNTGVLMGIISHQVASTTRFLTGAFTVFVNKLPATRMTTICLMNGFNMIGMTIVPSQVKVLLLCA